MKLDSTGEELPQRTPSSDRGEQTATRAPSGSQSHTQVKVCGLTSVADAVEACDLGVDALGLVFYPPSSRNIEVQKAAGIIAELPPFVAVTGLFLNAEKSLIEKVLAQLPLSLLQFHGTESAEFCESFNRPYIKSIAMKSITDVHTYAEQYTRARGFLLDSNLSGAAGGSGKTFDWKKVPTDLNAPVILAGGLNGNNVGQAVMQVRPTAVDVSSGVESGKGIKDHALMREFIQNVRAADSAVNKLGAGDQ